jgi:hypothetical protein
MDDYEEAQIAPVLNPQKGKRKLPTKAATAPKKRAKTVPTKRADEYVEMAADGEIDAQNSDESPVQAGIESGAQPLESLIEGLRIGGRKIKASRAQKKTLQEDASLEPTKSTDDTVTKTREPILEPKDNVTGIQKEAKQGEMAAQHALKETLNVKLPIGIPAAEKYATDYPETQVAAAEDHAAVLERTEPANNTAKAPTKIGGAVMQTSRAPAKSKKKAAVAKDSHNKHAPEWAAKDPERLVPVIIPTADAAEVQGELAQSKEKAARKPRAAKKAPAVVAKPTVEPTRKSGRRNVATTAMQESDGVAKPTQSVPKKTAAPATPTRKARSIPSDAGDDDEFDDAEDAEDAENVEGEKGEVSADNVHFIPKQAMGVQKKYSLN